MISIVSTTVAVASFSFLNGGSAAADTQASARNNSGRELSLSSPCAPYPELTKLFKASKSWVGADGAYSIPLGEGNTLWTFGDTWIGSIKGGRRVGCEMINNSAAIQRLSKQAALETSNENRVRANLDETNLAVKEPKADDLEALEFLWKKKSGKATSLFKPNRTGKGKHSFYWPAAGLSIKGKLYCFLHEVRPDKSMPEPFQFKTITDALVKVENPLAPPERWKSETRTIGNDAERIFFAAACLSPKKDESIPAPQIDRKPKKERSSADSGSGAGSNSGSSTPAPGSRFVYIYCTWPEGKETLNPHPLILARISLDHLERLETDAIEFLCKNKKSESLTERQKNASWTKHLKDPVILFPDAAPEMSVGRIKGASGYYALYMPPLTKTIRLRHAPRPEGPWSDPVDIYDCPETDEKIVLYSAKFHEELARKPGELVITYCRNSDDASHVARPEIYFPQGLKAYIRTTVGTTPPGGATGN